MAGSIEIAKLGRRQEDLTKQGFGIHGGSVGQPGKKLADSGALGIVRPASKRHVKALPEPVFDIRAEVPPASLQMLPPVRAQKDCS